MEGNPWLSLLHPGCLALGTRKLWLIAENGWDGGSCKSPLRLSWDWVISLAFSAIPLPGSEESNTRVVWGKLV